MRGVVQNAEGGVEALEYKADLPLPQLKDGEVLIKNQFGGVNYIDTCVSSDLSHVTLDVC